MEITTAAERIRNNGGGTFNVALHSSAPRYTLSERKPKHGYYVSLERGEMRIPEFIAYSPNADVFERIIGAYIREYFPLDESGNALMPMGYFLGVWYDDARYDSAYVFDRSVWFADFDNAEGFGILNKQDAIWDCKNNKEIRLND